MDAARALAIALGRIDNSLAFYQGPPAKLPPHIRELREARQELARLHKAYSPPPDPIDVFFPAKRRPGAK